MHGKNRICRTDIFDKYVKVNCMKRKVGIVTVPTTAVATSAVVREESNED